MSGRPARLAALALVLAACGSDRPATIGVLMWGYPGPAGARVMADWLAEHATDARPVTFVVDSQPPTDGRAVHVSVRWLESAEAIVQQPDLLAVIGHIGSRESLLTAPIYARAGIPLVVPTGTNRARSISSSNASAGWRTSTARPRRPDA